MSRQAATSGQSDVSGLCRFLLHRGGLVNQLAQPGLAIVRINLCPLGALHPNGALLHPVFGIHGRSAAWAA